MLRLVVFLAFLAAVVYAVFWLIDRRSEGGGGQGLRRPGGPTRPLPRGPVGPDDDEDFLRELERKRRHMRDEGGSGTT
jgi:hypothetical protein